MEIFALQGQLSWRTLLSWRTVLSWGTVECKFNGKIIVVILVRDRCPRGKEMEQQGDNVASWWPWNVFEILVSCYGDVVEVLGEDHRSDIEMEQQGDDVASWWPWNVFEILVSCYGDVMEPTSVSVKWLSFTNRNSDEAQISEHG
ncbi:hypothetical protein Tco_0236052 [Tanacetum coccineum]